MVVLIIGIGAAWVIFSTLLVTVICINSSRLSRVEEPFKVRSTRARLRTRRKADQIQTTPIPANAEIS